MVRIDPPDKRERLKQNLSACSGAYEGRHTNYRDSRYQEEVARAYREHQYCFAMKQKLFSPIVFVWLLAFAVLDATAEFQEEIPFVPTPVEVVDKMLEMVQLQKNDVVYDLGSGDGRVVIRAAKKYGARGVGIEMDQTLLEKARKSAEAEGVSHLVEFRAEDALKTDLSPATVVTLYMLPWFNEAMKPNFRKYLKPGSRIVAHDFGIEGWKPDKTEKLPEPEKKAGGYVHYHTILLWNVGNN